MQTESNVYNRYGNEPRKRNTASVILPDHVTEQDRATAKKLEERRKSHLSVTSSIQTSQISQTQRDTKDVYSRRVCFELYESAKLARVYVKVDADFQAILKL